MEKYYLIIFKETRNPEVYTYINKSKFTEEDIKIHKKRWDEKNYPYVSVIVSE